MRPLAELLNAPAWLSAGGRTWPLVITHGVLLECGRELGVDAIAGGLDVLNPSAQSLRALLWAALARAGAEFTIEQVGTLIEWRSMAAIRLALMRAWIWSMPEPEVLKKPPRDGKARPPLTGLRAWAVARIELGISDAEWLEMTPRQVWQLSDVRLEQMQQWEFLAGTVASAAANSGFCRPDPPLSASAFMIHPFEEEEEDDGKLTGEKILKWRERAKRNARRR